MSSEANSMPSGALGRTDTHCLVLQTEEPKDGLYAMLTLALDDSTETADPKPQTVMFSIGSLEKAERFCALWCRTSHSK